MTHGDDEGTLGEVGDGPEPANLTKMAGGSEVEDDGDGDEAKPSGSFPSAWSFTASRRSSRSQPWARGRWWARCFAAAGTGVLGSQGERGREQAGGE